MKRRLRRRKRKRYFSCCPDQVVMGGPDTLVRPKSDNNERHLSMYPCSALEGAYTRSKYYRGRLGECPCPLIFGLIKSGPTCFAAVPTCGGV